MYERIVVSIDASPDSPDGSLLRTAQFAKMTGGTVFLLHIARSHVVSMDINAGSGLGVMDDEDDVDARERSVVQEAVNLLAAEGVPVHGELISATDHDAAEIIVQRATELRADVIVLGYQHYRGSVVAEHVIHLRPPCSIILARPPL